MDKQEIRNEMFGEEAHGEGEITIAEGLLAVIEELQIHGKGIEMVYSKALHATEYAKKTRQKHKKLSAIVNTQDNQIEALHDMVKANIKMQSNRIGMFNDRINRLEQDLKKAYKIMERADISPTMFNDRINRLEQELKNVYKIMMRAGISHTIL